MATGTMGPPPVPPPPPSPPPPPARPVVDERPAPAPKPVRDGLAEQLARMRAHVWATDLIVAVATWLIALVAIVAIAALVEHWIAPLGALGRAAVFLTLLGTTGYLLVYKAAPLVLRPINDVFAAKQIERFEPSLKNSLVNFLFIQRERVEGNAAARQVVVEALRRRATADVEHVPIEAAVDRGPMFRCGYALVAALAALVVYKIVSPKDPFVTAARVFAPWAQIAPPSRVSIANVSPGAAEASQGDFLDVEVDVQGLSAGETPKVLYTTADRQIVDRPVPLTAAGGARFRGKLPGHVDSDVSAQGLQQDLTYRIVAGDATSLTYPVKVLSAASIDVQRIEIVSPDHTRRPREVVERVGDIRALEGAQVTIHARANRPIASASVDFFPPRTDGKPAEPTSFPMERASIPPGETDDGRSATFRFALLRQPDGRPRYEGYQLRFAGTDGVVSRQPVLHKIDVIADLPPEVEILRPAAAVSEIAENQAAAIEVRALDPDFGLRRITLRIKKGHEELPPQSLLDDRTGFQGQAVKSFSFDPKKLGLRAGDEVRIWAVAEDNRLLPQGKQIVDARLGPAPNISQSAIKTIQIVPATPTRGDDAQDPIPDGETKPNAGDAENPNPEKQGDPSQDAQPDADETPRDPKTKPEPSKGDKSGDPKSKPREPGEKSNPESGETKTGDTPKGDKSKGGKSKGDKSKSGDKTGDKSRGEDDSAGDDASSGEKSKSAGKPDPTKDDKNKSKSEDKSKSDRPKSQPKGGEEKGGGAGGGGQSGEESDDSTEGGKSKQKGGAGGKSSQAAGEPDPNDPSQDNPDGAGDAADSTQGAGKPGKSKGGSSSGAESTESGEGGSDRSESSGGEPRERQSGPSDPSQGTRPAGKSRERSSDDKVERTGEKTEPQGGDAPTESTEPSRGSSGSGAKKPGANKPPLHDGEVLERALEHMKREQGDSGAGEKGEQPQGDKADPADASEGEKTKGREGSGAGAAKGSKSPSDSQVGEKTGDSAAEQDQGEPSDKAGADPGKATQGESGDTPGTVKKGDNVGAGSSAKDPNGKQSDKSRNPSADGASQPKGKEKGENPTPDPSKQPSKSGAGEAGQEGAGLKDKSGSDAANGAPSLDANSDKMKDPGKAQGDQQKGSEPSASPSSKKQSNSKGGDSGDRSGGGGAGGGQPGKQAGNDSPGSQSAGDSGQGAANEVGDGETSDKAGSQKETPGKTGKSGDKLGQGSGKGPRGDNPTEGEGAKGEKTPGHGEKTSEQADAGKGRVTGGGKAGQGPMDENIGPREDAPEGDEANEAYARKAAEMALKHLRDQRDEPDPKLLDELGWTKDDLRRFLDRWEAMKRAAEKDVDAADRLEDTYRGLGLTPTGDNRRGATGKDDAMRDVRDAGARSAPPTSYEDQFRAFRKAAGKKGK